MRGRLIIGLLIVGGLGGGGYYVYASKSATQPSVLTAPVAYADIENNVSASGTLQPKRYVDVGVQVSGQLKSVNVAVGDRVTEGALIAEIEPQVYLSQIDAQSALIDNLKAQLKQNEATLRLKRAILARSRTLQASSVVSSSDLDAAQADADVTAAQGEALDALIAQAQYTLAGTKLSLTHTKIYAPMSGRVVSISANQGQTLNANQSAPVLLRIADLDTMTVQAEVSEADVPKLSIGMEARFNTLGRPDTSFAGHLTEIYPTPQTTNNVVLYYALFDVPNPDGTLMINMSTEVFFIIGSVKHALTIPYAALTAVKNGSAQVQVLSAANKVEQRTVSIGLTNRVTAQVLSGLSEGEKVVITTAKADTTKSSDLGGPPPF